MSSYRKYAGFLRTPPPKAWLIRERRMAKGRIEKLEKALDALPEKIAAAKADLAVLDAVIPRREVKVEPSGPDLTLLRCYSLKMLLMSAFC